MDFPDDPANEYGLDTVKRKFINEYERYQMDKSGALHLMTLHHLKERLENEGVDVEQLIEDTLPR